MVTSYNYRVTLQWFFHLYIELAKKRLVICLQGWRWRIIVNHHFFRRNSNTKCHVQSPTNNFVCSCINLHTIIISRKNGACDSWRFHLGNASHHPLRDLSCAFSSWQRSLPQGVQKGLPNTKMSLPFLGTKVIKNEWLPVLLCTWLLRCSTIILDPLSGGKNASLITILGHRLQGLKFLFERRQLVLSKSLHVQHGLFSCKFTASALKNHLGKFPNLKASKKENHKTTDTTATAYKGGCYKGADLFGPKVSGAGMTWEPVLHLFPSFSHIHPGWSRKRAGHQE